MKNADGQAGQEVEPVAWWDGGLKLTRHKLLPEQHVWDRVIPLYTHPAPEGHAAGPACSAPDEEYPPVGHPLQELGARLADLLQSDHFNNIEPMLLAVWEELKRARAAPDNSLIDEIANQYWDRGVAEVAIREYIRRSAGRKKG